MSEIVLSILYSWSDQKMAPLRPVPQKRARHVTPTNAFVPTDSRMWKILNPEPPTSVQRKSVPILHHTYKEDLRRGDTLLGVDSLLTESVLKRVEVIPYVPNVKETKIESTDIVSKVVTDFKIKGGKINVTISCPIENLYAEYYSKGVKPPLKERVLAYSKIGYSDQKLAKMIKFEDEQKKKLAENEKFLETIFGDPAKKKSSAAPKKKTLAQLIGFKKPKYATNDDFNEDEEEED
jgi:hypothetical protein